MSTASVFDFQTRQDVCKYMVSLIPDGVETVLEPTPGSGNIVKELVGYRVTAPDDFYTLPGGRFDAVVMNPPFTPMQKGYDIFYKCMERSDIIIALMPYLTIINSEKRTRDIFDFGLKSITHLPRSVFKGSRVQTCILELERYWPLDPVFKQYQK